MKRLDRSLASSPVCLTTLSPTIHTWEDMNKKRRKAQVWTEIYKFQDKFCAYCESDAFQGEASGHIEHFYHKGEPRYRGLTFTWSNLFGCCSSTTHCGHYKDQILEGGIVRQYDPNLILKPDIDDPEEYFQFLPSGKIKTKDGLDDVKINRAEETIRALNLNASELKLARETQINLFHARIVPFLELLDTLDEDVLEEYYYVKDEARTVAHRTAVKQAISWL